MHKGNNSFFPWHILKFGDHLFSAVYKISQFKNELLPYACFFFNDMYVALIVLSIKYVAMQERVLIMRYFPQILMGFEK
jgi:hypothetical protein